MRVFVWLIILVLVFSLAGSLYAVDEQPIEVPAPISAAPASVDINIVPPTTPETVPEPPVGGDPVPPLKPSRDVQPESMIPGPILEVPSPIAPSKPPTGFPGLPIQEPVPTAPGNFVTFTADQVRTVFEEGVALQTIATGNVTALYRDIIVTAESGQANYRTNIAVFEGNVIFKTGIQEVRGNKITLNLRTGEWSFLDANTAITPQFARGWLNAPLYAAGEQLQGRRQQQIIAYNAEATTCNLPLPHYELISRSIAVYPDNKAVLRDVTIYALGRRLFTLPRLVIPLRDVERNPNIIPTLGQTAEEGYYLKTAYSYMGNRAQSGLLLLDLMTKKGIAQGLRHTYQFAKTTGGLRLYHLSDRTLNQETLTGRLDHNQELGTLRLNLSSDFRSNSYIYAPQSKTLINQLTLTRPRPTANSSLVVNQNIDNVFQRSSSLSGVLRHDQRFANNSFMDTSFDYSAFTFNNQTQARLTSQMLYTKNQDKFDWSLSAQKLTDLTDEAFVGGGRFAGIERLPELSLVSDSARLGKLMPFQFPLRLNFRYGRYAELPFGTELDRTYVELDSPIHRYKLSNTWNFSAGAGFRQYVYSDDTAQYSIDTSAELNKSLGSRSFFGLFYRYQQPRGSTPFRFDFVGRYNTLNAQLNVQETEKLKLSILGGYNFEQHEFPWQDATLRFSFQPTNSVLLYTATGYDFNRSNWRTLINQLRIRAGDTFKLDIGTRYDPIRKKLASIRTLLDTPLDKKTRLQALIGFNGFTDEFDYRNIMLTRDLHCWEVSLSYVDEGGFYENKGLFLNFRIKAFPIYRDFGTGPFGQALDTSVGQVY